MRAALRTLKTVLVISLAAAGGCEKNQSEQNTTVNTAAAPADIEALPPDESSTTPSNELQSGSDKAEVNDLNTTNYD